MSETPSSAQRSASVAKLANYERFHLRLVARGIIFALALAVVMLRLYRLTELPPGLFPDEGAHGVDALRVLQGEHAVFFSENYGREGMIVYAVAVPISLLGRTALAVRLPTALASAGTVFVVFWLGRVLFGRDEKGQATPWRGLLVGGVGAGLLAVSIGQTVLGRTAFRANFLPLLLSLCLALLWWGWQERSLWRIALAGACAGLLPYTYIPARFTPFLFLLFGLSFLPPFRSGTRKPGQMGRHPWARLRAALPRVSVFLAMAGLVAAPLLVYFALHPEHFFMRGRSISVFAPGLSLGDSLALYLLNVWEHLLAFGFRGDVNWRHNFAGRPMLNPWEAAFFWLGVGMAVWRWQRRPAYRLLLLWLAVLFLPATLARDSAPNTLRMIGAVPAIYLLVAVGVWEAFRILRERYGALQGRAGLIFRENWTRAAIAMAVMVGGLILVQGVTTYRNYFHRWAVAPELYRAYEAEWPDLAHALNEQPSATDMVYLISSSYGYYSFDYLYQGVAPAHIFDMARPDLAQKISSTLAAKESVSTVKLVEWNTNTAWIDDDTEPFAFLLRKYGRYVGSDELADFRLHNYVDISLGRPWTFYDYLEPLTVHYDGGITLHGLALGQGGEQLSTGQPLPLGGDRSLWAVLQWQTAPGLDIDYAISLRLHNMEGERVYQADDLLWKPTNHTPTSQWSADEVVESLIQLEFPPDIPPGDYELRMVVYNFETQAPTVQQGVWEPEITLARLRLAAIR